MKTLRVVAIVAFAVACPGLVRAQEIPPLWPSPGGTEVTAKHGRTWIDYPSPLFTFRVDENGRATATDGTIRVAHADVINRPCFAVALVGASWGLQAYGINYAAGTCEISMETGTLPIKWLPADDTAFSRLCTPERRMAGWTSNEVYPRDVKVHLRYATKEEDQIAGAQRPLVRVECARTTCPAMQLTTGGSQLPDAVAGRPYSTRVYLGGKAPVRYRASGLPPGLSLRDGVVSGTATTAGTYPVAFGAVDACPVAQASELTATLKVRDSQPPVITAFDVSPDTLTASGGNVTLSVQATDNIAVGKILMTTKHPDGHSGSAQLPLVSGTPANGTWKLTFALPLNTQQTTAVYEFTVSASDLDLNGAKAGPKTVVISAHADPRLPPAIRR